jgi:hypothetical protein
MTQVNARIDKELYDRLAEYSKLTSVPVSRCIAEALNDWLQSTAVARVQALQRSTDALLELQQMAKNSDIANKLEKLTRK